ncbi:hypothetical protein CXB51_021771 [Gossypium anomalum]|uniref:Amine oxidase domain-containing protein n=1 Tax=Gossypium anomalum TaxID=47600 RepID=A0A8J5YY85_9ROSI|nr:hypothetical protein CXB51_021771 [Gossypium anomalum]
MLNSYVYIYVYACVYISGIERQEEAAVPCVIVIGGGISGLAAARTLTDVSFKAMILHHYWLHGVCNENPLAPLISSLGLKLYRTSGDNSVLYDHDLESYTLFDMDGRKVPQEIVVEVGDVFKRILKETEKVRDEHKKDMSVLKAISIVLDRNPELRQEGLAYEVMQWYICRMEAWFAADTDMISLKCWDQAILLGGHGLMVQGYDPIIKELAKDIDVRLNHRVSKISRGCDNVVVNVENGLSFIADAAIVTVPLGVLKANLIQFEPKLPEWKVAAISDIGVGNENKIALLFDRVFWPNVELLGIVACTSYSCGYFLNLHKATGHPILVYMAAGRFADDLEKFSDEYAVNFVMLQLKKMFPDATEPVQYLVSHWGTDPNSLGCYSYDPVGMAGDVYDKLREPLDNLFFGGEAVTEEHQGSVHGAYSSGVLAARNCESHLLERLGDFRKLQLISFSGEALLEPIFPLQISRM